MAGTTCAMLHDMDRAQVFGTRRVRAVIACACIMIAGCTSDTSTSASASDSTTVDAPSTTTPASSEFPSEPVATASPSTSTVSSTGPSQSSALPERFTVTLHEWASTGAAASRPRPFENWIVASFDSTTERHYLSRVGQAEPGDIGCSELLITDGTAYERDTGPSSPDPRFTPIEIGEAPYDLVVADLVDSVPILVDSITELSGIAQADLTGATIDVDLDQATTSRLIDELTTMGLSGSDFGPGHLTVTAGDRGLVRSLELTAPATTDQFTDIEIALEIGVPDAKFDNIGPDTPTSETRACAPIAIDVVGEWGVSLATDPAPVGTFIVREDGSLSIDVPCFSASGTSAIGPFGLHDVVLDASAPSCDDRADQFRAIALFGPTTSFRVVDDRVVATSPVTGTAVTLTPQGQ